MNRRQKRFCEEYLIDCNAVQAAIRAGYAKKTARSASQWINENNQQKPTKKYNPEMRKYIDEQLERIHEENTADAQEVMEFLSSVVRGEQKEETLKLDGEGMQTVVEIAAPTKDRIKAAELIGKRYGIFKDGVNVSGAMPVVFVDDLGNDEE